MNKYKHTKGKIWDNALEALLRDPLFRQRIEQNEKGRGSYKRKQKHHKRSINEARRKLLER